MLGAQHCISALEIRNATVLRRCISANKRDAKALQRCISTEKSAQELRLGASKNQQHRATARCLK